MRTTVGKIRQFIREAAGPVIATVQYGHGRALDIGGRQFNLTQMAHKANPGLRDDPGPDGEYEDRAVIDIENGLLQRFGVTHVIDTESFGDDQPRPVAEYLKIGEERISDFS
jgi:hypothetical protein